MTPLISILVPAYNHEAYVAAAIESVLQQDYPRIELIVIDDGSRDETPSVIESLRPECERRCERVEMLFQENAGTCRTVNRLLDLARGDFCLIMASDDQLAPGALTTLLRPMLDDADVGVVVGENTLMDDAGARCYWDAERRTVPNRESAAFDTLNAFLAKVTGVGPQDPEFGSYAALLRANHIANGCLIRRTALDRCARMTPEAPLEDYWLHLQLSKVTRYGSVADVTFRYRWHSGNASKAIGRMLAMTRLTLEHEASCFRADLTEANRSALDSILAIWRNRVLAFVRRSCGVTVADMQRLGVLVDVIETEDEASLNAALADADPRGYGYVAYVADRKFLPGYTAWGRLTSCFSDARVAVVAGKSSFVVRASALASVAREAQAIRRLPGPGLWRSFVHFVRRRYR